MMAIQAAATGFPLAETLGIGALVSVLLILLRSKLGRPAAPLASTDDVTNALAPILAQLNLVQTNVVRLEGEVVRRATESDVNRLGEKVNRTEALWVATQDRAAEATNKAEQALREAAHVNDRSGRMEARLERMEEKLDPLPELIGRLDENVRTLLRRSGGRET